ncbi:MAG TPA: hypothetical protein VFF78_04470 [Anaerolineaceae bacterium]|nr:hypothetical protein [Anaerolineaceae bacterium]
MNLQTLIERILESENLTDGLEDAEANLLINWGVARLPEAVQSAGSTRSAGSKTNHLMALMRTVNQLVADRKALPPEELDSSLKTLGERFQRAFGRPIPAQDLTRRQEIAGQLAQMTDQEAVNFLLQLMQ